MKKLLYKTRIGHYSFGALAVAAGMLASAACVDAQSPDQASNDSADEAPSLGQQTAYAQSTEPLTPSRFITVNGISIAVFESSGRAKPSVLFLHGNTASSNAFARVMRSPLAKVFHFVAIDLPGYGRSGNASSYNVQLFRSTIATAAATLGVDDGVLAGFSLGGDLALQSIAALPKIKGLFLDGTAPIGISPELPPPFLGPTESPAGPAVQFGAVPNLTPEMVVAYVTAFFRPGFSPIPNFFFSDGQRTDPGTRAAVFAVVTGQDPTFVDEVAVIRGLKIPVALVVGSQDSFVRQAFLDGLAPTIPSLFLHKVLKIPDTGHIVQWERPLAYDALLAAFLIRVLN